MGAHPHEGQARQPLGNASKPNWLLIKEHDDFERPTDDPAITEEAPNSVVTGRSIEQIAASEDHVWNSKDTANPGKAWYRQDTKPAAKTAPHHGQSHANATHQSANNQQPHRRPHPENPCPPSSPRN